MKYLFLQEKPKAKTLFLHLFAIAFEAHVFAPSHRETYIHTSFRSLNRLQNRAIMRYALFVVWKLYTCRFATQQTEHFPFRNSPINEWRLFGEKCRFLFAQKPTACVPYSAPLRLCASAPAVRVTVHCPSLRATGEAIQRCTVASDFL